MTRKKKKEPETVEEKQETTEEPEKIAVLEEVPLDEEPIEVAQVDPWVEAVKALPEPTFNLTQRWYGEEFLPAYREARNKLRKLAGL